VDSCRWAERACYTFRLGNPSPDLYPDVRSGLNLYTGTGRSARCSAGNLWSAKSFRAMQPTGI